MEGGSRRQRWIRYRIPQNGKPPHSSNEFKPLKCSWHPKTVPSWEKDFCKVVGCFDWYTLVQMKKYMHFYDSVISWNDSAGEEAFHNAKRRYWAEINGIQCDVSLPDPDLYIQNIDWNTEIAPDALDDLNSMPASPKSGREPVVIFGDKFYANQGFSPTGWGDAEEKPKVPADDNYGVSYGQNLNWAESCDKNVAATGWTGCDDNNNSFYCYSFGKKSGWGDYCENDDKNAWKYSDGDGGGRTWYGGGWNGNDRGWLYEHNGGGRGSGGLGYGNPRVHVHSDRKNHT